MTEVFIRSLDILVSRGISNALEIANEIDTHEVLMGLSDKDKCQIIIEKVIEHFPRYFTCSHNYQRMKPLFMTVGAIKGKARYVDLVLARHTCIYLMRKYTDLSLMAIASEMGGMHHSSCIHAGYNIQNQYDTNKAFRGKINRIIKDLDAKFCDNQ